TNWQNAAVNINWIRERSNGRKQTWTLGHSQYDSDGQFDLRLSRNGPLNLTLGEASVLQNNQVQHSHFRWHETKADDQQTLTYGLRAEWDQVVLNVSNDTSIVLANDTSQYQVAAFVGKQWLREKWQWQTGVHLTYYSGTQKVYPSPRISASYTLNDSWQLKTALQYQQQFLRAYYHENRFGRSFQIWSLANDHRQPPAQSSQIMLGGTWKKGPWLLDIEGYYRYTSGTLEHVSFRSGFDPDSQLPQGSRMFALFEGNGEVLGLDVLFRYTKGGYQGWLAYTLSRATRTVDPLFQGAAYPSVDDRRHQLDWVHQYRWKDWRFTAVYVGASGAPFLPLADAPRERNSRSA
ncbi:MAG: hypothetical protein AAF840_19030, partial [Bacteroidota bacterium]